MKITGPKFLGPVGVVPAGSSTSLKTGCDAPLIGDKLPVLGDTPQVIGDPPLVIGDPPQAPQCGDPVPADCPSGPEQRFNNTRPIYDGDHLPPGDPEGTTLIYCSICGQPCDSVCGTLSHCHNAPLLDYCLQPFNPKRARLREFRIKSKPRGQNPAGYRHIYYLSRYKKYHAQIRVDGRLYHIGSCVEDHMAAKLADNAVHYLTKRHLLSGERRMNFPEHYDSPPIPSEYETTELLIRKVMRHRLNRRALGLSDVAAPGSHRAIVEPPADKRIVFEK